MANIKSAKKRILVTKLKTDRNKAIKSRIRTSIKKVESAVSNGNKEEATLAFREASSQLHRAARKGIYHKNNVARKISKLSRLVASES